MSQLSPEIIFISLRSRYHFKCPCSQGGRAGRLFLDGGWKNASKYDLQITKMNVMLTFPEIALTPDRIEADDKTKSSSFGMDIVLKM